MTKVATLLAGEDLVHMAGQSVPSAKAGVGYCQT
jgi:hypothetical protein